MCVCMHVCICVSAIFLIITRSNIYTYVHICRCYCWFFSIAMGHVHWCCRNMFHQLTVASTWLAITLLWIQKAAAKAICSTTTYICMYVFFCTHVFRCPCAALTSVRQQVSWVCFLLFSCFLFFQFFSFYLIFFFDLFILHIPFVFVICKLFYYSCCSFLI